MDPDFTVLGSLEHQRRWELLSFFWDHGVLELGAVEDFNGTYSSVGFGARAIIEGDCSYCGQRKHFQRKPAAWVKEIHLLEFYTQHKREHPHLTLGLLEYWLAALPDDSNTDPN